MSAAPHLSAEAAANLPRHVAVIMDGNGRWAKQRGLPRIEGHRQGAESARAIIRTAGEVGIKYLTLYAFSSARSGVCRKMSRNISGSPSTPFPKIMA